MKDEYKISGTIADVVAGVFFKGEIVVSEGRIKSIEKKDHVDSQYILPGFVDAHIHVESSMLIPSEFARLAVMHGTVATVSDPHEIANVCGTDGVYYMINNGKKVPFKFYFGAPSCVPATCFETAGATVDLDDVRKLMRDPDIVYLAEMMNFPGVLNRDPLVMDKINAALEVSKVVDGHAPGLRGEDAKRYIEAGISTDHECFTKEEALDKIRHGMKIIIREGSAAKNFEALYTLIDEYPEMIMLCSDDKHPDELVKSHINEVVSRAISKGCDIMNVLRSCSLNTVRHYNLNVGLLQPGDPADFILVSDLKSFSVSRTYIDGNVVYENGKATFPRIEEKPINNFNCRKISIDDLHVEYKPGSLSVIVPSQGQLVTAEEKVNSGFLRHSQQDNQNDILKLVILNRYHQAPVAVGYIKGFGIQKGAIASTVAHDSHNIIATGADDESIVNAINCLVDSKGGVCYYENSAHHLPLEVGGLMSLSDGMKVAGDYEKIDRLVKLNGSKFTAPFMTLSFMALLVIPSLKLSDKGLFDGNLFQFRPLIQ